MSEDIEYKSQGFWDGFNYGISYPIEFKKIPDLAKQLPEAVQDIIHGPDCAEYSRRSVLGSLTGYLVNPTLVTTYLTIGAVGYALNEYVF